MKKYRLKKDLWGKKAGEIISVCDEAGYNLSWFNSYIPPQCKIMVDVRNPDYFEEVKEKPEFRIIGQVLERSNIYIELATNKMFLLDGSLKNIWYEQGFHSWNIVTDRGIIERLEKFRKNEYQDRWDEPIVYGDHLLTDTEKKYN